MKRKLLIIVIMWLFAMSAANAQTGTWSGKLDVQGTKLSLVFHLDEKNPTADSPDQGAKGIPIQVEHENNLSALRDGLPSNEKTCIEAVEGVNHLFQHCTTGTVSEYGEIDETISPAVLETIIQWIL